MSPEQAREVLVDALGPRYGIGEAKAIARIVFEDAFNHGRAFDSMRFEEIQQRLVSGEPLQYVLGQADFFGLKFLVSPAVLIPRQETEELVAWVLSDLKDLAIPHAAGINLLDIGLGSGCIGITLKKKFPAIQLFGLEKSPEALAIARENALQILKITDSGVPQFQFFEGNALDPAHGDLFPSMDVVISNPPYIPESEKGLVPDHVLAHEPALALFVADPDPLLFYRAIADFSLKKLKPGGALYFECNEFNAGEVVAMLHEKGFDRVTLRKDLSGADRMVKTFRS